MSNLENPSARNLLLQAKAHEKLVIIHGFVPVVISSTYQLSSLFFRQLNSYLEEAMVK